MVMELEVWREKLQNDNLFFLYTPLVTRVVDKTKALEKDEDESFLNFSSLSLWQ